MKNPTRASFRETRFKRFFPRICSATLITATIFLGGCAAPGLSSDRIAEIISSPDRSAADRTIDMRRKPAQFLAFTGVGPGMVVLDLSAGAGYTTELLARAVGPGGKVYGQSAPPRAANAAPTAVPEGGMASRPASAAAAPRRIPSPEALAQRARNPAASNIIAVVQKFETPIPAGVGPNTLDLVTLVYNYHDLGHQGVDRAQMNKALFNAMKPGGAYVIVDHHGMPGTGISQAATLHRVEAAFLRREVESAGFNFVAESDLYRNPADPRDKNTPDQGQAKDGFLLKFRKP
ncbi:class I SAM-dependent methyltransferase [Lacisediminimonas sp.]|uniref:class I SAM-dependent methyltransferase n=1 Tax=Lacisediminimonas sp. TaxID=3060582 RepID=UPI002716E923|nr:hypothetical protein [Lacisediminimonas sp.]MDO8299036.1 hypothetical protein [Lacisediminimonas sp.]